MTTGKELRLSAIAIMGLIAGVGLLRGMVPVGVNAQSPASNNLDKYRARAHVDLNGYFRDFEPSSPFGGHPDFGVLAAAGAGRYAFIAADRLGADGVPEFRSSGQKVFSPWRDAQTRTIIPTRPYIEARTGDMPGSKSTLNGGAVSSAASFSQWFRDDLVTGTRGVLRLTRDAGTGTYLYSGYLEDATPTGSVAVDTSDASTTYAADTFFVYERGRGQFLEVATDGDAWVYVDGNLVIDGGSGAGRAWEFTGIAVDGGISMGNNTLVSVAPGSGGAVSTNATGVGVVDLRNSTQIQGDLNVGAGADPVTAVLGANKVSGEIGSLAAPVAFPPITVPTGLGDTRGDVKISGQTLVWTESYRCGALAIEGNTRISVAGHVTIVCDSLTLDNRVYIDILPEASLAVYVHGSMQIANFININVNTKDPGLVTFYVLGTAPMDFPNNATIYANFLAPSAPVSIGNGVILHGSMMSKSVSLSNSGRFVIDSGPKGSAGEWASDGHTAMTQRIDLDRCGWLRDGSTARLNLFFADRRSPKSLFTIRTNIDTLNLAAPPVASYDPD